MMRRVAVGLAVVEGARKRTTYVAQVVPASPEPPFRVELLGTASNGTLSLCTTLDWWPDDKDCDRGCPWAGAGVRSLNVDATLETALFLLQPSFLRIGGSLQDLVTHSAAAASSTDCDVNLAGDWAPRGLQEIGYERGGCYTNADVDKVDALAARAGAATVWGVGYPVDGRVATSAASAKRLLFHLRERQKRNASSLAALSYGNELCGAGGLAARVDVSQYAAAPEKGDFNSSV